MSRIRFALTSPARHAAVELRAYLAAEADGFRADPVSYWLAAEAAEARSDAARRGAATRAAKRAASSDMASAYPYLAHLVNAPAYSPAARH